MIHGFTGTRRGMTVRQTDAFIRLIDQTSILHHGDCLGADAEAHTIALKRGIRVHVHPPIDPRKRAFCTGGAWMEQPVEHLTRNRAIVHMSVNGLIAMSRTSYEERRSGTWATVRYARMLNARLPINRPIWIVYPDGHVLDGTIT